MLTNSVNCQKWSVTNGLLGMWHSEVPNVSIFENT